MNFHPDWLIPDWPAPASVRGVCTTRTGGVSTAPFDTMNLGDHVGDASKAVAANRRVLARAIAAEPMFMQQVHGHAVAELQAAPEDLSKDVPVADACVATRPGVACTIMVADCLPVLFTNRRGTAVAAAHAGWRGLAGVQGRGVLESAVDALRAADAHDDARDDANEEGPAGLLAWLGPCIGPQAFEVGEEVKAAFVAHTPEAATCFRAHAPGKWLADLPALARLRLRALGLGDAQVYGNDGSAAWCTVGQPSRFFSYRRERVTGRMAACVWLA